MEEICARKQREGESFELYYESIMKIAFRLAESFDEYRLTQQLLRNLLPDVRQALLFVPVSSVAHLRQLIYKRENLLGDVESNRFAKNAVGPKVLRRAVAALEVEEELSQFDSEENASVETVKLARKPLTCWNCNTPGHTWDMCLAERCIFCYGCGAKDLYKPQCPTCIKRAENPKMGPVVDSRRRAR